MPITAKEVIDHFSHVHYKATDGLFYPLKTQYPICFQVHEKEDHIYLDTGGPMEGDIDFFEAKVENGELHRLLDNGEYARLTPELRIV